MIVNNQEIEAKEDSTLLQAASAMGIVIPTLCFHEALGPHGSCRVCLVEIVNGARPGLVASCTYPVEEGLVVETNNTKVLKTRRIMVELLLARCPDSTKIRGLANDLGIAEPRFDKENESCILCGLCVRVCREIGINSVGFIQRGTNREVTTPFQKPSEVCLGCQACAFLCPTGAIKFEDVAEERKVEKWKTSIKLQRCSSCSRPFFPEPLQLYLKEKELLVPEKIGLCEVCRRKSLGSRLASILSRKSTV